MVQHADQSYVEMSHRPYENISYYNFAPIHIGGTDLSRGKEWHLVQQYIAAHIRRIERAAVRNIQGCTWNSKIFISSIDFLQITPGVSRQVRSCWINIFFVETTFQLRHPLGHMNLVADHSFPLIVSVVWKFSFSCLIFTPQSESWYLYLHHI
jgi:hypothetical protein